MREVIELTKIEKRSGDNRPLCGGTDLSTHILWRWSQKPVYHFKEIRQEYVITVHGLTSLKTLLK